MKLSRENTFFFSVVHICFHKDGPHIWTAGKGSVKLNQSQSSQHSALPFQLHWGQWLWYCGKLEILKIQYGYSLSSWCYQVFKLHLVMEVLSELKLNFEPGFRSKSKCPAWGVYTSHSLAEGAVCLALQKNWHELWDHAKRGHQSLLFRTSLCSNPIKHQALSPARVNLGQMWGKRNQVAQTWCFQLFV